MQDCHVRLLLVLCLLVSPMAADHATAQLVQAVAGQPFGVAKLTLSIPAEDALLPLGRAAIAVRGPQGRVHYPAITDRVLRRLLGSGSRRAVSVTVMFLFCGDSPFEVTITTPTARTYTVTPEQKSAVALRNMLRRWWRSYNGMFGDLAEESEHPPLIETYLTSMLARRLGLEEPLVDRLADDRRNNEGLQTLELLTGAESVRMQIVRATSLGVLPASATADQPLPAEVDWHRAALPDFDGDVVVESLAMRVPEECFYVRFGQYSNFLWLNGLLQDYGGEIGSMVAARGYRTGLNQRIERQLAMKQGVLAELLGPQAIADVAAIGMDTFTREGAAVGAIFEARGTLLGIDLARQRQQALLREKENGASLTTVSIRGRDVSVLSTPNNQLRSYYLVDGKYHLVTNSRAIVERFVDVAGGAGSLGASEEFRYARTVVPTSRMDTIFIYFSSEFFRNLLRPAYQIELRRRLQAATDVELLRLAQLAAESESVPAATFEDLAAAGLLPAGFATRPDQSQPVDAGSQIVDSVRGQRGFFVPVPDVRIDKVSTDERRHYEALASYYTENWRQVDPILLALKRDDLEREGAERVTVDAFVTPMSDFKYQVLMSMLDTPSPYKLVPPSDNIILIDAAVRGGILFPRVDAHRIFLGVQDHEPLIQSHPENVLSRLQIVRTTPGFLGGWPNPGFLDSMPFLSQTTDEDGFSELPLGLLRWQGRGFSVVSMDKGILTDASRQLGFLEEGSPAQIRIRVSDLSRAKFGQWLNQMGYERSRQVSVANARIMSILRQQLKVPLSQSRAVVEELLNAQLVCALGGDYEIAVAQDDQVWQSTAWPGSYDYSPPEDYVAPPLDWFRGLEGRLVKYPGRLVIHGQIDLERKERKSIIKLPFLEMLGGKKQADKPRPVEY